MARVAFFQETSYKSAIRVALRDYNEARGSRRLSFRKIAEAIGIQHTYLSRALNQESVHLSEDQLYAVATRLGLEEDDIEFLFLLRSAAVTRIAPRRERLERQIAKLRKAHLVRAQSRDFRGREFQRDIDQLLDPYCVLVHTALSVPAFASNPRALCQVFGFTETRLKSCLRLLADLDYLTHHAETVSVSDLKPIHQHFSKEHPLVRTHHQLLRTLASAQLLKTDEDEKRSLQVTFSADAKTFQRIGERFFAFIAAEVEPQVIQAESKSVYQLSFDLFRWG